MKKSLLLFCVIFALISCDNDNTSKKDSIDKNSNLDMNVKDKLFDELFRKLDSSEIKQTLAELMVQEEHTVITAGTEAQFNSMAASWEGLGRYFNKPMTLCLLGANRYTLEFIQKQQTYTMSFFPQPHKKDLMAFGRKSGRDSDKMKETKLTFVQTLSGNMTYKEAYVIIECQLFEITTVKPDDFYDAEGKKFVEDAFKEAKDYHKLVFGTITNVWVKK